MTNIVLREFRKSDAPSIAKHADNIRIWDNVRDFFPHPYSISDAQDFIKMVTSREGPALELAIEINGEVAGCVGIEPGFDVERVGIKLGYWLGEEYWGRGIMPEAVRQMVEYIFQEFPEVTKIFADVFAFNRASQRVLQKVGFELEAVLRKGAVKNGEVTDIHYYTLFRK
jgi:RimJ/RimL family protein N-acetyltransferase